MSGVSNSGSVGWTGMNLPAIWSLIGDENYTEIANRPVDWDNLITTASDQRKRLAAAAERLKDVWSEKSESAQKYQEVVSNVLSSMDKTIGAATKTQDGLNGIVTALATAHKQIAGWKPEREAKSHDIVPRWYDGAEDEYDAKAQSAMITAEKAVAQHSASIDAPDLFVMKPPITKSGSNLNGGSGGNSTSIDGSTLSASPKTIARTPSTSVPYTVTPSDGGGGSSSDPGGTGTGGGAGSTGPVLSGIAPTVPSVGVTSPAGGLSPIGGPASVGGGGLSGSMGVLPLGAGSMGAGLGGVGGIGARAGASDLRRQVSMKRGLPSGAVIGEESERGIGARGAAGQTPMGGAGRGRGGKGGDGETIDGEADQMWATDEGVVPVIEPDRAPVRHDPGPGVIGFSR